MESVGEMPVNRIIPSLLLQRGRLVKGVQFSNYRDAGAPATTCRAYSAQGADEVYIADIDASRMDSEPDFAALRAVADEVQIPVTFAGGIRSVERARAAMDSGADKIGLNTTALDRPVLIGEIARLFGAQAVVLGVDVVRKGEELLLYDHRSAAVLQQPKLGDWIREAVERGAGEIRIASVEREGKRTGLDTGLWKYVRERINVPIILEGGAGSLDHVAEAMRAGVDSIALGTLLVFSDNNLVKIRRYLGGAGLPMRP